MVKDKIAFKAYKYYNKYFYLRFRNLRGFTRISSFLKRMAERQMPNADLSEKESIFNIDADNYIILDSCRSDFYSKQKDCDKRITLASNTPGFIEANFSEGDYSDFVCIVAPHYYGPNKFNAWTGRDPENVFHDVVRVFEDDWNKEFGTVMPEAVVDATKKANEKYPEKKKLIHIMQPHWPFVYTEDLGFEVDVRKRDKQIRIDGGHKVNNIWHLGQLEKLTEEEVKQAYNEEVESLIPKVEGLAQELGGKTIITSDHGEFLGENGLWGHWYGSKSKKLREVPLDIIPSQDD